MQREDEKLVLDTIAKWAENEVRPIAMQYDHADEYPHDLVAQMRELGLFGATIAEEHGGLGLSARTYSAIVEEISRYWMSPTGIFNSHLIVAACLQRAGTDEQKQTWLPKMAAGELRAGVALTEPDAGTDLQGIRIRAVRKGDRYIVNGSKTWITNSLHGNCLGLLVKTDPDTTPPRAGMSMLFVETKDDTGNPKPGLTIRKLEKLGYRSIDTCELNFEDFEVPAENLIGTEEGKGFYHAVGGLELGRINVAARGSGIARGALELATRYAQERKTFGKPIAQHQAIQLKLGEMAAKVEAARLLVRSAAEAYDRGERCDMEAGIAKYFASETAVFCAEQAMRTFGGYSYSKEYEIERYYRDALIMCIGEGTNEMQRIIIARQLIARNPA